TSTSYSPPSVVTRSSSPTFSSRAGFTGWPRHSTRPSSHAFDAKARVLKKRDAHSHLSIRTPVIRLFCNNQLGQASCSNHPCEDNLQNANYSWAPFARSSKHF